MVDRRGQLDRELAEAGEGQKHEIHELLCAGSAEARKKGG
jgi:hypothetical protein